jgi:nucleoid-associated protein YgaU
MPEEKMNTARKKSRNGNVCPKMEALKALFWNAARLFAFAAVLLCAEALFAQTPETAAEAAPEAVADVSQDDGTIGYGLRRNQYFLESLRQRNLANVALSEGEYEMSEVYSAEAVRYARLSDEYIAEQLKRQRALRAVSDARKHLEWANAAEVPKYYPNEYESATGHYAQALEARDGEDWDGAEEYALLVGQDLAGVAAPPAEDEPPPDMPKLPSKYTVRPWDKFGDCFWNIAYWFYDDYFKWPILFEANRDKLPDRDNPDLVEVGTVIDIPPVKNETRIGMWDSGRPYKR